MKILLLSGFGPVWPAASSFWESDTLSGTFFDQRESRSTYHAGLDRRVSMDDFVYRISGEECKLLRPRASGEPHLTTETLCAIVESAGWDYELFRLEDVWAGTREPVTSAPDVVALSTTFICNRRAFKAAIDWISARFPSATLVVGGQYSNLKYQRMMTEYPRIDFIVRGDAEVAFPQLLEALSARADVSRVPNLVRALPDGDQRQVVVNEFGYINLDAYPSPRFKGQRSIVPYESMRGCPFTCKFCSFPFASPEWRYKSAEKIVGDWARYAEVNGAEWIRAMDSTFTVPPKRFKELLEKLPQLGVRWEAYTRANVINSEEVVAGLEASHCSTLSIGFESMNNASLKRMDKKVTAEQNAVAQALLARSSVDFRGSFIIGYPGETPEEYEQTHDFLVNSYSRHFLLSVFSLTDETMPVWNDAERYQLKVPDANDPDSDWCHVGMSVATARQLHRRTLREVRWKNEKAVTVIWQIPYELPVVPNLPLEQSYRIEKLLERLAFAPKDFADDPQKTKALSAGILHELESLGVSLSPSAEVRPKAAG